MESCIPIIIILSLITLPVSNLRVALCVLSFSCLTAVHLP